jgi:hypothetical protein
MIAGGLADGALLRLGALLGTRSDLQLERWFGSDPGQRLLFWAVAASYDADAVPGFEGSIVFRLLRPLTGREPVTWTVIVHGRSASAHSGSLSGAHSGTSSSDDAVAPTATIQTPVGEFVRIALGRIDPAEPLLAGRLSLQGDIEISSRLAEMFHAVPLRA